MTGTEYVMLAMRTNDGKCDERLKRRNFGQIINGVLGLTGESGEVADIVKKAIFHEKPLDIIHLKKELGDVMWYIALICDACGFNLDEVMDMNVEKLKARFPEGFNCYDANHRKEGDI